MTETITQSNSGFMAGLLANAARNAPVIPDDTLPRYGMSFLLPLALLHQKGSNFVGDFNPKREDGSNRENINYYPQFELIAFYGGQADIPFEKNPLLTDEPVTPEPFDFGGFQANAQKGYNFIEKNARECAATAAGEFAETGYKEFRSLTGFCATDPDRGLSACQRLIELVLPLSEFKQSVRLKNGISFNGPFLDEMETFIRTQSMQRILDSNYKEETKEKARKLLMEIRDGVSNALKLANRILNETEAEMKNPNGVKKGYDEPNLNYDDAPVPTDLYCLAHTNRTELDNKQLQASTNIGKEIAEGVVEALRGASPAPATMPTNVMTADEVQLLLEREREESDKRYAEMEARFMAMIPQTAAGNPPANEAEKEAPQPQKAKK